MAKTGHRKIASGWRALALLTALLTAVVGCLNWRSFAGETAPPVPAAAGGETVRDNPAFRGVWISFIEFGEMIRGKSADEFDAAAGAALDSAAALGLDTVILHVRAHCDAFYPSEIFPWAAQTLSENRNPPDYDPLARFLAAAHSRKIKVQAWINPYRVASGSSSLQTLPENSPALSLNREKQELAVLDTGIFLNPGSEAARQLVIDGVRELLERYDVDGIQMDDYFYPTADESFDAQLYAEYTASVAAGGAATLSDWRRKQVDLLVSGIYSAVKASGKNAVFGISPAASVEKNRNEYFADVALWAAGGYCDYLCPQLYFGFDYPQENSRFAVLANQWRELCGENVRLIFGLAAYKAGKEDAGSTEWQEQNDLLARQAENAASAEAGTCFYSFTALFSNEPSCAAQRENLKNILCHSDGESGGSTE